MSKPASDTSINAPINASINPKQKELLLFSVKRCRTPELIQESDYAALRDHGYDDEDILDMSGITAFFGLSIVEIL